MGNIALFENRNCVISPITGSGNCIFFIGFIIQFVRRGTVIARQDWKASANIYTHTYAIEAERVADVI